MNLTSLTPDLLDRILAFGCVSYASLPLWLCGSKALQRTLASGVTKVVLVNTRPLSICRVPRYLEELPHLRELKVHRKSGHVLYPLEASKTIQRLNPGLQSLRLDFAGSHQVLAEQPHDQSHGSTEQQWTLKSAFPLLHTLELLSKRDWTVTELESLPPHLTSLSTGCPDDQDKYKVFMRALPHSLVELFLPESPYLPMKELLELVPHQSWQVLAVNRSAEPSVYWNTHNEPEEPYTLPPTLTTTDGFETPLNPSVAFVNALPSSLTTYSKLTAHLLSHSFGHLTSLTSLGLSGHSAPHMDAATIRTLPPCLKKVSMVAQLENLSMADWPRDLVHLKLTVTERHFPVEILPPGLTYLYVQMKRATVPMRSIALLPRTLTYLHLDCTEMTEKVDFPPNLRTLNLLYGGILKEPKWVDIEPFDSFIAHRRPFDISDPLHILEMPVRPKVTTCFPFHKLPKSITSLQLPCMIPASQLKHLPPRLKRLSVTDILEDADFDSTSAENVVCMHEVFCIGRTDAEGVDKSWFDLSPEASLEASPASLLPRSLTSLDFFSGCFAASVDWCRIPPSLTKLRLGVPFVPCHPISMDFLFTAPLSELIKLSLTAKAFTDAHVKALPRKLRVLQFGKSSHHNQMTPAGASFIPIDLNYRMITAHGSEQRQAVEELLEKAEKAFVESDLPTLRSLLIGNH